jgi:hypothetical protein
MLCPDYCHRPLWGMRLSLVWLVAHEYLAFVDEKLSVISRALSSI